MINTTLLAYGLNKYYNNADKAHKIIIACAGAAAAAEGIGGSIPGLAVPAIIISSFGAVWTMYGKLCKTLGITLRKSVLKLLARAALSNIAANLSSALLTLLAAQFIPGASVLASAAIGFISVYLAGMLFLQMILRLAEKSKDASSFDDISEKEMKDTIHTIKLTKDDLDAAKAEFSNVQEKAEPTDDRTAG